MNTNPVIIRKINGMLKKAGLIQVRRGIGGASLLRPPDQISLLDAYLAVDVAHEGKLFNFHEHSNPDCTVGRNIEAALRTELLEVQEALEHRLAQTTIEQLNKKFRKLGAANGHCVLLEAILDLIKNVTDKSES